MCRSMKPLERGYPGDEVVVLDAQAGEKFGKLLALEWWSVV